MSVILLVLGILVHMVLIKPLEMLVLLMLLL